MRESMAIGRFVVFAAALVVMITPVLFAAGRIEIHRDIVYREIDGVELAADIYAPNGDGPFPGVLVVHGGAWMTGSRTQLALLGMQLAREGFTAVHISYRLAPEHVFPAQIEDCRAALRWMRANAKQYKIEPSWIAGYGYSAGGQLVALMGTTGDLNQAAKGDRLQAVVAGGAPCDFRNVPRRSRALAYWLGGTRAEKPDLYREASPLAFISKEDPPMFFFHGERDKVPRPAAEAIVEKLDEFGTPAEFYVVPAAGHIGAVLKPEVHGKAISFLKTQLQNSRN